MNSAAQRYLLNMRANASYVIPDRAAMNPHRQSEIIWKIAIVAAPVIIAAAIVAHLMGWDR